MDWQRGDLALCVTGSWRHVGDKDGRTPEVRRGGVYTVRGVRVVNTSTYLDLIDCLSGYRATGFVKITPGHQIKGSEVDQRNPWNVPA